MKNTRLAIALAALTTSTGLALAQDEAPFIAAQEAQAAARADQLREVERAVAASQRAVQVAQVRAVEPVKAPRALTTTGVRKGSAGRALIIPKDPTDAKGLVEAEEDMNVMAHILDKAASEDRKSGRAMGIAVFGKFSWGGASPQNLFIEGNGALFFLNVNYPLQAAPDKDAAAETKEKPVSEWDNAKKEMAGSGGGSGADSFFAFGESFEHGFGWDSGSSSPYDPDKVEDLKSDLITALKNAANIRKLKADETVTVVVQGISALAGGKTIKGKPDDKAARLREEELTAVEGKSGDRAPTPAKLVLRVRKADADAFQNGKLELADFKKKVTVMVY
jgi:hypothetical protein